MLDKEVNRPEFRSRHLSHRLSSCRHKESVLQQSNGYYKRFWRRAELFWKDSIHVPVLLSRQIYCNTWPVDICRSFKRFSVHYGISWKWFGPSRSTQRLFPASSIQTLASRLCWQTSCPVVGVEIQTGCYFEANPFDHHHHLGAAFELGNNGALL